LTVWNFPYSRTVENYSKWSATLNCMNQQKYSIDCNWPCNFEFHTVFSPIEPPFQYSHPPFLVSHQGGIRWKFSKFLGWKIESPVARSIGENTVNFKKTTRKFGTYSSLSDFFLPSLTYCFYLIGWEKSFRCFLFSIVVILPDVNF
jgi:hypothetical protein